MCTTTSKSTRKYFLKTSKNFTRASRNTQLLSWSWKRTLILFTNLIESRLLTATLCKQCLLTWRLTRTYSKCKMMTSYSSEELLIAKRIYRQTRESKRLLKVTIYSLKSNPRINRTQKYQLKVRRDRKLSSRNYYSLILGRCFRYSIINHQISISKSIKDHHQQMKINSDFRLIIKISC